MTHMICILPQHRGVGGPASFKVRITAGLADRSIDTTSDPHAPNLSAILVIGGTRRLNQLWQAHRRGIRIVQRLNGMNWVHRKTHTGLKHYLRSEVNNWILSTIRRNQADHIVYQSAFTEGWWDKVYGKAPCPSTIIHNGVDLNNFSPDLNFQLPGDRIRILVVEGHFGGGYEVGLENAIRFCSALRERIGQPVELILAGDPGKTLPLKYVSLDWIEWKGVVSRADLPGLYHSAHLLFSADINASCPNAVIEALACGLPVVGYETGSLTELLGDDCGAIASYGADPTALQPANPLPLVESAFRVLAERKRFGLNARRRAAEDFGLEQMVAQYLKVLLTP